MQYTLLGNSNLKVSRFCLGTMMFGGKCDRDESIRITRRAVEAGVNFVDAADVYTEGRCETILGEALAGVRDQVVLATKAGMKVGPDANAEGISRFHTVRALEASLKRLKTDRIDLFHVHWPTAAMNLHEMMRTLDDLTRQGKILYSACSNFPAWVLTRSLWLAEVQNGVPLVAAQYPYNLIERGIEVEILPMAQAMGVGITVYRPLAIGVLTGKYLEVPGQDKGPDRGQDRGRGEKDERIPRWTAKYRAGLEQLGQFAAAHGFSSADAANAWLCSQPAVAAVVVGISRIEQLEANLKGFDWQLTADESQTVGNFFPTQVTEEAGGKLPHWRRSLEIG